MGRNDASTAGVYDSLTPFEYRILELKAQGMSRSEIAQVLKRSPQTVSNSLTLIKEKLGAGSLIEAAWLVFGPRNGRPRRPHHPGSRSHE